MKFFAIPDTRAGAVGREALAALQQCNVIPHQIGAFASDQHWIQAVGVMPPTEGSGAKYWRDNSTIWNPSKETFEYVALDRNPDDAWAWHAKELGAWYWDDMAQVHRQSPHAFAQHMSTPTLVIHGALDYRVPDAQGLAYYNTLKAKGVPSRLVFFPDENHWILKPQNSRLWFKETFAWLARHVKTGGERRKGR